MKLAQVWWCYDLIFLVNPVLAVRGPENWSGAQSLHARQNMSIPSTLAEGDSHRLQIER